MKYQLSEILDIDKLRQLCETFTEINGTVTAILDLEGNILVATGWQPICTQFHRLNSKTKKRCTESDTILAGQLKLGQKYNIYKCKNGLVDIAVPIIIENEHIGNFFTGQFFTEKPNLDFFREQAIKFGFDEAKYQSAIIETPIFSEEQIKKNIKFLVALTETICNAGLKNLKNIEQAEQLEIDQIKLKELNDEYSSLNEEYKSQNEELQQKYNELVSAEEVLKATNTELTATSEALKNSIYYLQKAKEEAEESKNAYKDVVETTSDLITVVNSKGQMIYINHASIKFYGLPPEECIGRLAFDFILPEDREPTQTMFAEWVNSNNDNFYFENRQKSITGRIFSTAWNIHIERQNNEVIKITSIARDLTDRKQAEDNLRQSEKRYRDLITNLETGIVVHAPDTSIILSNHRAGELLGLSEDQMKGKVAMDPQWKFIYEDYTPLPLSDYPVNQVIKTKDQIKNQVLGAYRSENDIVWLIVNGIPVTNSCGEIIEIIISFNDITDRKNAEILVNEKTQKIELQNLEFAKLNKELHQTNIELKHAKDKAEESDRLKTAFLQNMSHEIRTPMNAIMGFSDLLVMNFDNKDKLHKFSDIIGQRCNDLLEIINDILDIAKIESGQLTVNNDECDLNELFIELSSFFVEYQKRIGKQHIDFTLQAFDNPSQNLIMTDKVKLKQIFINLISNAFKFTENGSIKGGCKFDENQNPIFYVSDTGLGIPLEKQQFIYERFSQINQGSKMNIGGTGLGLPIVKGLVNLLGGEIHLDSEPKKGSTFYFSFPFKPVRAVQQKSISPELNIATTLFNKTVLIVEDDLYNAEYLKEILSNHGLNILHTAFGKEAVDMTLTQSVDLILMDINLPDLNGYEAIVKIRQSKPQMMVIAQTAYAAYDERQKAINAGCIDYISKPIKKELLLSLLSQHLTTNIN